MSREYIPAHFVGNYMPRKKSEAVAEANKKNLKPVQSTEEARKRGRNGGIKSGEVRRAKKNLQDTIKMLMGMPAMGATKASLKQLGLPEEDQTNMAVFVARLYAMAVNGNLKASELLAQFGGLTKEEERKDNEDKRKTEESKARIAAINANLGNDMSVSSGDDEGDVVIYVPRIDGIKEWDGDNKTGESERGEA